MKKYIGIDIGGMSVKLGIVTEDGTLLNIYKVVTNVSKGADGIILDIANGINALINSAGVRINEISGIGVGCPGSILSKEGVVSYSNNLEWKDVEFVKTLKKYFDIPIFISNDANVAAYGEAIFGGAKGFNNTIVITLGTGVGGGIIIDKKLYEGFKSAGAEIGHMKISNEGRHCTCGRLDCFETYSSATALMRDTKIAMLNFPNSKMWDWCEGDITKVDGRTAFECKDTDKTAKMVIDSYIKNLGDGLTNIINIFRPDIILLGGGVSAQKDNLLLPLISYIDTQKYGGASSPNTLIKIANLGNDAGIYGGVALAISQIK